jgi:hypothetical protein
MKRFIFSVFLLLATMAPQFVAAAPFVVSDIRSPVLIHKVNTIADLRLITGSPGRSAVQVLGYYEAGDGGGGPVRRWVDGKAVGYYTAVTGVEPDDGGSIIVPTGEDGSGAWLWEWSGDVIAEWFGAQGDGITDDSQEILAALATGLDVYTPNNYYLTQPISVGQQRLYGQNGNKSKLIFNHSGGGFAVTVYTSERGGGIDNLTLDSSVDGLKGLNMIGTVMAKCDQVFINNFTLVSLQLGDTAAASGIYWSKIGRVRIRLDSDKDGDTGVLIDGQNIPGSNANSLEDVVIGGNFKRSLHIKGNGNTIKNGTIELTRGNTNVISMIYIEGGGNTVEGLYVEPIGIPPATLVEFSSTSSGNTVNLWPQYVPLYNMSKNIIDNGAHNKVKLRRVGSNFVIGPEAEPSVNLLLNSAFKTWRDAENPTGWLFGTVGRISRVAPEAVGGPSILRMTLTANNASIQSYVTDYFTSSSGVVPLDVKYLQGKPIIVGVWCRTSVVNAGGIKFNLGTGGVAGLGQNSHSGSGNWELLLAHGNVSTANDRVGLELRSQINNDPLTGTVDFRDPFFIIGSDITFFGAKPIIDTGGKIFGDLEFPLDFTDKGRGGILRFGLFYVWVDTAGKLRIGSTRPTDATWDSAGAVVGTQT